VQDGLLPGGIAVNESLNKDFAFAPLTGAIELALAESANSRNMPDAVTRCLNAALQELGGESSNTKRVATLSVGDRHHLMRQLQILLDGDCSWYSATCTQCHADFDFQLTLSQLPIKPAGTGYPFVDIPTSAGNCRFRVPNGSDQSSLAQRADEERLLTDLLQRCLISVDGQSTHKTIEFSSEEQQRIESALENMAPEIGCEISVCCIECQSSNTVTINPYACIAKSRQGILPDIHKLAWYYHWSEHEILHMPKQRRQMYLDMIDVSRAIGDASQGGV